MSQRRRRRRTTVNEILVFIVAVFAIALCVLIASFLLGNLTHGVVDVFIKGWESGGLNK